ncbi:Ubiquitin-specific protease, partial [Globisporangium splendens]
MAAARNINDDELEQNWVAEAVDTSDDDEVVSAGSEDEFEEDYDLELATAKRKRDGDEVMEADAAGDDDAVATEKKQKVGAEKSNKLPAKPSKGLHKMTRGEHFKIVNDIYSKQRGGQMTTLELADGLNESHFAVPTKNLGKHKLELLPSYLHHFMPRWKKEFLGKGKKLDKSPYFIVLCSSALRAVEIIKHLSSFQCKIAKLFGKHLKADDQADTLTIAFHPIAVGTPARVKKLLEMDALSLEHTTHVILDMEKDKKELTILELKDTAKEMVELLQYHLIPRLNKNNKMKLALY